MENKSTLPHSDFSNTEKTLSELTRIQSENITLLLEVTHLKFQLEVEKQFAQIEKKVYSGIKKYFK